MYVFVAIIAALTSNPDDAVAGLSSEDFRTRERSAFLLTLAGKSARPALIKAANGPCPEARIRASVILEGIYHRHLNSFRPFPPIDGMWYCDKRLCYVYQYDEKGGECAEAHRTYGAYLKAAEKLTSADGDYPTYRRAMRMVVEQWLFEGKSDEWVRDKLADVKRRDDLWRFQEQESRRRAREMQNSEDVPPPGVPMIMPGPMGIGVPWFPPVINAKDAVIK